MRKLEIFNYVLIAVYLLLVIAIWSGIFYVAYRILVHIGIF